MFINETHPIWTSDFQISTPAVGEEGEVKQVAGTREGVHSQQQVLGDAGPLASAAERERETKEKERRHCTKGPAGGAGVLR